MSQWLVIVILVSLIEFISSQPSSESGEYPLTKSLGYPIRSKLDKTDSRISQKFMEKYQEMKKASQESFENFEKREEKRRRRVIDEDKLDLENEDNDTSILNETDYVITPQRHNQVGITSDHDTFSQAQQYFSPHPEDRPFISKNFEKPCKDPSVQNRHRRGSNKLQSAVGLRRARSQALRRVKLNSQSLKSHLHHSKQSNLDYVND